MYCLCRMAYRLIFFDITGSSIHGSALMAVDMKILDCCSCSGLFGFPCCLSCCCCQLHLSFTSLLLRFKAVCMKFLSTSLSLSRGDVFARIRFCSRFARCSETPVIFAVSFNISLLFTFGNMRLVLLLVMPFSMVFSFFVMLLLLFN